MDADRLYDGKEQLWSLCDNSNPNAWMAEKLYGYSASGLFGYSHIFGGYTGGRAEYARVRFADVGPLKVPDTFTEPTFLDKHDSCIKVVMKRVVATPHPIDPPASRQQ